jgi:hypothetical protein
MRKRCTPSQSLNDMPRQDISNFWDLIAPSERYLTPSPLSTGYDQEGGSSSKVMVFSIGGSNWDWQFLHALQGVHCLFWMAGILYAHFIICNDNSQLKSELKVCYLEWWPRLILLITFHQFQDACNRKSIQQNLGTISHLICTQRLWNLLAKQNSSM